MINDSTTRIIYNGDGITKEFPFVFPIINKDSIKVIIADKNGIETTLEKDYFVDEGKKAVFYPGYAPGEEPAQADIPPLLQEGEKIAIIRETQINQLSTFGTKWPFNIGELGLDKLTMIAQEMRQSINRTLLMGDTENEKDIKIPAGKPNTVIGWDWTGKKLINVSNFFNPCKWSINVYKSVSDLKQDWTIYPGKVAMTLGYYNVGDGGCATYIIRLKDDKEIIDDGSIIELKNKLVAKLIIENEIVNLKQFGAKGDGETDDSKAFINAWKFTNKYITDSSYGYNKDLWKARSHRVLHIPFGRYLITENNFLAVSLGDGFNTIGGRIYGDGMFTSEIIFKPSIPNAYCFNQILSRKGIFGLEIDHVGFIFDNKISGSDIHFLLGNSTKGNSVNGIKLDTVKIYGTKGTVIYEEIGDVMGSETKILNSRFRNIKTLIKLNKNAEAVNHQIISTDCEHITGHLIELGAGSEVSIYGGSFTFYDNDDTESSIIHVDESRFTKGILQKSRLNSQVSVYGARTEFHSKKSRALLIEGGNVDCDIAFVNCHLAHQYSKGQGFAKSTINNGCKVTFDNCVLPVIDMESKYEFVNNPKPMELNSTTNTATSLVIFRECSNYNSYEDKSLEVDYYTDYSQLTGMVDKWAQTVVYDNCSGLPSITEYGTLYRSGIFYNNGTSHIIPLAGMYLPYSNDGKTATNSDLYYRLYIPKNTFVQSIHVCANGLQGEKSKMVTWEIVDGKKMKNNNDGKFFGRKTLDYSKEIDITFTMNKCFVENDRDSRTLWLRQVPSDITDVTKERWKGASAVYAIVM